MEIAILIGFIVLLGTLFSIEGKLRNLSTSNNEIVELLKEIKQKK